jgi:LacI family transcriptional regulator
VILAGSLSQKDIASISRSVPVVVLAMGSTRRKLDSVGADNRGGAQQVTTHLVTVHGHKELAFIGGPPRSPDSDERFAGYRLALAEAGLPVPEGPDARGDFTEAGGERAMHELLEARKRPPRAVVVGNDEMGIAAMSVLRLRRLRVPLDVAVTGFDDISSAQHVSPALTTVRQPMREMGETAVRMLLDRVGDATGPVRAVTLPTQVVIRRSCGCTHRRGALGGAR